MAEKYLIKIMIAGTILFLVFVCFIAGYLYIYYQRQHRHVVEKDLLLHLHEKELMAARLEEQERVMNQISRDIHDNVAQKLNLLQMNHKGLIEAGYPDHLTLYVENNTTIYGYLSTDLRNISYALNSDYVQNRGLGEAIRMELDYIAQTRQLRCSFEIIGTYRAMEAGTELMTYRILQEAVNNVIKHARATTLKVVLHYESDTVRMVIEDDGSGFDQSGEDPVSGLGFRNMQHRAALANGVLTVQSNRGKGCSVCLTLSGIT